MTNKKNFTWKSPNILIKKTKNRGLGVFANKVINKNELILVMGGYIFDIEDENNLNKFNEDKPIEISQDFSISPITIKETESMIQHSINHSCQPNCGWKGQLFLVAMKKINKGEEVVYDYATIMHSNNDSETYFKMVCECGSRKCRGVVTEDDWKLPELQKKYDGYFQWYLQDKIDCLKKGKKYKKPYTLPKN